MKDRKFWIYNLNLETIKNQNKEQKNKSDTYRYTKFEKVITLLLQSTIDNKPKINVTFCNIGKYQNKIGLLYN